MQIGDQRHALQALTTTLDSLQPVASTRPFLLVGYSMGGRIALRFAARRPEKVAGVVVLGGSPGIDDPVALQERAVKDENLAAKFRSMSPPQFLAFLRDEWYRAPLWGGQLHLHPGYEAMVSRRTDGVQPSVRAAALERESVARQPSLWEWLKTPSVPVMLAAGERDPAYAEMIGRLRREMPKKWSGGEPPLVSTALIRGAAHALLLEAPDPVAVLCELFFLVGRPPAAAICPPSRNAPQAGSSAIARDLEGGVRINTSPRLFPFSLPLQTAIPLAHGEPLKERAGYLLLVSGTTTAGGFAVCGVGELCPLPGFHRESKEEAHEQLSAVCAAVEGQLVPNKLHHLDGAIGEWLTPILEGISLTLAELLPSVRCALECALLHLISRKGAGMAQLLARDQHAYHSHVRFNGLMTRGEQAAADELAGLRNADGTISGPQGSGAGAERQGLARIRTWKLKVGGADPAQEGARVATLLLGIEALGLRLRLDANQAWSTEQAAAFSSALRIGYTHVERQEHPAAAPVLRAPWPPPSLEFCEEPLESAHDESDLQGLFAGQGLRHAIDERVLPAAEEVRAMTAKADGSTPAVATLRRQLASSSCAALVLKPALVGGIEATAMLAAEAQKASKPVIITSAFESGVLHAHIAIAAAVFSGPSVAHGLSTYERLNADALTPPFATTVVGGDLIDIVAAQAALDNTADRLSELLWQM